MSEYNHPKWQKRRLEVMERDGWQCVRCGDAETTLNVHHRRYVRGRKIWEYKDEDLATYCRPCHEIIHGRRPSSVTVIGDILSFDPHGYMLLAEDDWVCSCGCGWVQSKQEFNPTPISSRSSNRFDKLKS